ncbi:hypothetical protein Tco_0829523 [Tanacetum coccineum]
MLTNEMMDALSVEPPPHIFKKKSLIAMGVIMELQNGICLWPTTRAVEEDEAKEEDEGEAVNIGDGGSAKMSGKRSIRRIESLRYCVLGISRRDHVRYLQNILFPYGLNTAYWSFLDTTYWILFPSWSLVKCWHKYAISFLMDTAYWLSEQDTITSSLADADDADDVVAFFFTLSLPIV